MSAVTILYVSCHSKRDEMFNFNQQSIKTILTAVNLLWQ